MSKRTAYKYIYLFIYNFFKVSNKYIQGYIVNQLFDANKMNENYHTVIYLRERNDN